MSDKQSVQKHKPWEWKRKRETLHVSKTIFKDSLVIQSALYLYLKQAKFYCHYDGTFQSVLIPIHIIMDTTKITLTDIVGLTEENASFWQTMWASWKRKPTW